MTANQLVKVSPPVVSNFLKDAPASFLAADLRFLAVTGMHEPRQWVFVRVGHGKGPWDAAGRGSKFSEPKTVSMDTIVCFRKHPVCFRVLQWPSWAIPPPSHLPGSASLLAPSWAAPDRKKNAGVQCGRSVGASWVVAGRSDPPKCPILGLPMASGEFFRRPNFYVKVSVSFFNHKPHVTFCHRDFLWFEPLG